MYLASARCAAFLLGLFAGVVAIQPASAQEDLADYAACGRAALSAEDRQALPRGLLMAIGRVESGRLDPSTGRVTAWPWTINAANAGRLFATRAEALTATHALQARGVTSIDTGCFQVNLLHHPTAFATLEEAFDPPTNAAYAARFLAALHERTGSWEAAVAAYHSSTHENGDPYRDRVLADWGHPPPGLPAPIAISNRVLVWLPPVSSSGVQVWGPSPVGLAPVIIQIAALAGKRRAVPTISGPTLSTFAGCQKTPASAGNCPSP
jgi:hypothetical protein